MFGLKTVAVILLLVGILSGGIILERHLAAMQSPRPGLILPVIGALAAIVLSIQNFRIVFEHVFSLPAFMAAVVIFVFYAMPSIAFTLLYLDLRSEMEEKCQDRARRMRAAKRQQVIQQDLKYRYRPRDDRS